MNYRKIFNWQNLLSNLFFLGLLPLVIAGLVFDYVLNKPNYDNEQVNANIVTDVSNVAPSTNLTPVMKFGVNFKANYQDYRALVLDKYFTNNRSPLSGLGDEFIAACDKYGAPHDCTTIPAIAYTETGLCTLGISQSQFNCWGWGGSAENRILFHSYPEAIDAVTKGMVKGYGKNMLQPEKIAATYCGPQCTNWASGVQNERNKINNIAKQLNLPVLF